MTYPRKSLSILVCVISKRNGREYSKHIIHAVGPVYSESRVKEKAEQLASCYKTSLQIAVEHSLKHVVRLIMVAHVIQSTDVHDTRHSLQFPPESTDIPLRTLLTSRWILSGNSSIPVQERRYATLYYRPGCIALTYIDSSSVSSSLFGVTRTRVYTSELYRQLSRRPT